MITFALIPVLWPKDVTSKIGILETLTGLGIMAGPLIGGGLFAVAGYVTTFYSNIIKI